MADFVVVTAFRARDQMTKDLKKMGLSAKDFGRVAERSFRRAETSALSLKKIIGGILGAAVLRRGFAALSQGVRSVAGEFIDFDDSITAASAKFGIFDRQSQTFKDLAKTARDVAAATEVTAPQAAEGLRFLAKAGWEADAAMKALPSFVDLATASEMEFARASDIATDVLGQFGLVGKNAEEQVTNLIRVNDVMSKSVNMANIDMEDLFETLKMAAPIARKGGIEIEKFGAMAAFMGGAGIKGTLAGTALRQMITSLAAPSKKVRQEFKKLGIALTDKGNLRDPIQVLKELGAGFKKMGTTQQIATLKLIFGQRAIAGAAVSMDGATGKLQEFEESLIKAGGSAHRIAEFGRTSIKKKLDILQSAAIEMGFKVFDAFANKFPDGVDGAVKAIQKFDVKPIVEGIKSTIAAVKTFAELTRDMVIWGREHKGLIVGIGAAFATWKLGGIVTALAGMVKFLSVMTGIGGLKGALAAFGINPLLGAIALAIGGIAAGVYTIYDNWGYLKITVREFVEYAGEALSSFGSFLKGVFLNVWGSIKSGFGSVLAHILSAGRVLRLDKLFNFDKLDAAVRSLQSSGASGGWGAPVTADVAAPAGGGASGGWGSPGAAGSFAASPKADKALQAAQVEQSRAQNINFTGQMNFANTPAGATVSTKTKGAPPIKTSVMGVNP